MAISISEIIKAADYEERAISPVLVVGYCFYDLNQSSDEFEADTNKGFATETKETSNFNVNLIANRELQTNVTITDGFAAFKLSASWISLSPDITPSDPLPGDTQVLPSIVGGPPAISLGPMPAVSNSSFTHTATGNSVAFKSPRFTDKDVLDYRRINKKTIGGKLVVYRDPNWTARETISFEIENLTKAKVIELRNFLLQTAGQQIEYLDHRGVTWQVIVKNVGDPVIENVNSRYTVTLVLETIDA